MPRCQTSFNTSFNTSSNPSFNPSPPGLSGGAPRASAWARLRRLWPDRVPCALCGASGDAGAWLCTGCHRDLPWLDGPACLRCGEPADTPPSVPGGGAPARCNRCAREPPPFERLVAAVDYRFPVDAMIRRLKFEGELWLAPVLAGLLLERCAGADRPQCLLPIPLSDLRIAGRGFNQSAEIARLLSRQTRIPMRLEVLRRARDTLPQSALPLSGRADNLRGAFVVDRPVDGLHVALVDDVATTGATGAEAARALLRQGAARVDLWTVAHTLRRGPG